MEYGHVTGLDAGAVTSNLSGVQILPYKQAGTITNHYALRIVGASGAGTITNDYAVYQDSSTAKNYFNGNVGIGTTTPTAVLHLKAGTATANTSPLKFTSGTSLTTPEIGAVEYNGTDLYVTAGDDSSNRRRIVHSHSTDAPSAITPTGSPFTYQNTASFDASVIVSGGTMSLIEFSRDGATWYDVGVITGGMFHLSPSDRIRVTYSVAPTMTLVPR